MNSIAKKSNIEENAVVEYVVGGIEDTPANKALLYTAKNFEDLKGLFKVYEKIKADELLSRRQKNFTETVFKEKYKKLEMF